MKGRLPIAVFFTLALTALPVRAELRQWTDENGVKHFSNKMELPTGTEVERTFKEKESRPAAQHPPGTVQPDSAVPRSKPTVIYHKQPTPDKGKILEEIRIREDRQNELFERIYAKRRYVKRQGKKDIDRIRRLNGEIAALEKSGAADRGRLEKMKVERAAAKERLFNENLRTRKGVGEDIQEYKKIEIEIVDLKRQLRNSP